MSRWRPVLSFGAGSPGSGGLTPVLAAEGEPRVGNQDFKLRISNVVGGAKGFLLVADHLAPPRENPFGAVLVSPSWPKVSRIDIFRERTHAARHLRMPTQNMQPEKKMNKMFSEIYWAESG